MTQALAKTPPASASRAPHPAAALVMGGMVRCDQMGIYDGLGYMLRVHGHSYPTPVSSTGGGSDHFATLCHLRSRYLEARDLEAQYGKGALLNLEHPDVAILMRNSQLLTDREIEAAKVFRDAHPGFYADWRADAATTPCASGKGPAIWVPLGS